MNTLREKYNKTVRPGLKTRLALDNVMAVPQVKKVVINAGVGKTLKDPKYLESIIKDLEAITGQKPVQTVARKSIAGFKIRENQVVGVVVTLRGTRMYDFLNKLINVALPRVRDFRGINPKSFDGHGNYHLGMREQLMFPEIAEEGIEHGFGFEISIVTDAGDDKKGLELLKALGFPFEITE